MRKLNLRFSRIFWIEFIVGIALVLSIFAFYIGGKDKPPQGKIVFRRLIADYRDFEYYIMDGEGNNPKVLGNFLGAPAFSPDGKYIAMNCEDDVYKICILDISTRTNIDKEIGLPAECKGLVSPRYGLKSISWAPDGDRLAVVCNGYSDSSDRKVCILSLVGGDSYCWEEYNKGADYAVWSPVEDLLVVSTSGSLLAEIYLVGPDGENPVFLANGWGAEWSPDGKQIAFAQWQNRFFWIENGTPKYDETVNQYSGIAVINIDGSGFQWLYRNDEEDWAAVVISGSRLAWSPDGQFIIFQSESGGLAGSYKILRLDIETQEIICLSCFEPEAQSNIDPEWGP